MHTIALGEKGKRRKKESSGAAFNNEQMHNFILALKIAWNTFLNAYLSIGVDSQPVKIMSFISAETKSTLSDEGSFFLFSRSFFFWNNVTARTRRFAYFLPFFASRRRVKKKKKSFLCENSHSPREACTRAGAQGEKLALGGIKLLEIFLSPRFASRAFRDEFNRRLYACPVDGEEGRRGEGGARARGRRVPRKL